MLDFDANVIKNYTSLMSNYMKKCKESTKADYFYEFETTFKLNGIPVGRAIVKADSIQILPVGENCR